VVAGDETLTPTADPLQLTRIAVPGPTADPLQLTRIAVGDPLQLTRIHV
jgi:hypothetical protein